MRLNCRKLAFFAPLFSVTPLTWFAVSYFTKDCKGGIIVTLRERLNSQRRSVIYSRCRQMFAALHSGETTLVLARLD
jgi:hypothetical protein